MPLTPLPDQGIELPLSEYNRLRAFQGGGWFWDHDNQQVIRETLGDFLPRVEEHRDKGSATFQHFVGGTETASRSQAVGAQMNRVPRAEFNRLQRALENLKRKAQDPHTDPNARRVIEKFCLPDPAKDPDLYRIYGSAWNRRLLVLWGCEREEGTSLAPTAALNKIAVEPASAAFLRRLPLWLGLLLLLALLVFAALFWWQGREEKTRKSALAAANPTPALVASGDQAEANSRMGVPSPASVPNGGVAPSTLGMVPLASTTAASPSPTASNASQTSGNDAQTSAQATAAQDASNKQSSSSAAGNSVSQANHLSTSPAAAQTADSRSTNSTAATTTDRKAISSHASDKTTSEAAEGASPAASSPTASNALDMTAQPSPVPSVTAPSASPADSEATPTSNAPSSLQRPPPRLDIVKAEGSSELHDGKLNTKLVTTAQEEDGSTAALTVTRWTVDGAPSQDRAGRDVTTSQINLTLAPGKHRVSVTGTARGVPVEYETEVNVQIKSQGDVTVKPRGAK